MFDKLRTYVGRDKFYVVFILICVSTLGALFETFVLTSLALFVTLLVDTNLFLENLPFIELKYYLSNLPKKDLIYKVSYFVLIIVLLKTVILTLIQYFEINFLAKVKLKNSVSLFSYYITRNYNFYLNKYLPEMLTNSFHEMERAHSFLIQVFAFMREILLSIFIFYILLTKSLIITSVCFVTFTIFGLIYFFLIKNFLVKKGEETTFFNNKLFDLFTNALEDIRFIKVINCEKKYIDNNLLFQSRVVGAEKFFTFFTRLPRAILELFGVFTFIIAIFYFLRVYDNTTSIISELSIFGFAILRLIPVFSLIVSYVSEMKYFKKSFLKISDEISTFNLETENLNSTLLNKFNKDEIKKNINSIELKNIDFRYDASTQLVLKNASVNFENNKITGIMGPSGSGKSTLISILLGLLKPENGKIIFKSEDGDLTDKLPNNIFGYVPQNIFLIDDTIRKNIALGADDDEIDDKRVIECLKSANIYDQFKDSKEKLNTRLGYRGLTLSGGQIQRIGIARAMYLKPKFIILDESTNALDKKTEEFILKEISNLKNIMGFIIISHRESAMSICDKVFTIDKGQIK